MKVYVCFPEGKAKALTMSYDDGKIQDERLVSIFNRYGIRGTFNLNYGMIDKEGLIPPRIKSSRINELYAGHEIATHTMTHPTIARCPMTEVAEEILADRKGLEQITGRIIRGHAYPNGSYNEEIKQLFRQLGIAYARVVEPAADFTLPTDPLEWHPTCHHDAPDLMEKAEFFAEFKKKQYLKLMYVWGHSYEFDNHDNWNVIEDFCAYMSWYLHYPCLSKIRYRAVRKKGSLCRTHRNTHIHPEVMPRGLHQPAPWYYLLSCYKRWNIFYSSYHVVSFHRIMKLSYRILILVRKA